MNRVLFSSKSNDWATPQDLFDKLNDEFNFTLDVCAIPENAKCEHYYSPEQNGLLQHWDGTVWCNPPYGRKIGLWVKKAYESVIRDDGTTVVMLLPARTDTKWFHEYILPYGQIRFIRGRIKFGDSKNSAPFPSMIVVFEIPTEGARRSK